MPADGHQFVDSQAATSGALGQHYRQATRSFGYRQAVQIDTIERYRAGKRRLRPAKGAQQGRLATAVRSDQHRERTRPRLYADA